MVDYYGPYGMKVYIAAKDTYKAFEVAQAAGLDYVSFDAGDFYTPSSFIVWKEWGLIKSLLDDAKIDYSQEN